LKFKDKGISENSGDGLFVFLNQTMEIRLFICFPGLKKIKLGFSPVLCRYLQFRFKPDKT
jgi:hypothetical protein